MDESSPACVRAPSQSCTNWRGVVVALRLESLACSLLLARSCPSIEAHTVTREQKEYFFRFSLGSKVALGIEKKLLII